MANKDKGKNNDNKKGLEGKAPKKKSDVKAKKLKKKAKCKKVY